MTQMPWWAAAYFALYVAFAIWVVADDVKDKRASGFIVAQVLSDMALILAALSFWFTGAPVVPQPALFGLFLFGLSIFLAQAVTEVRRLFPDPDLSPRGNLFVATSGMGLALLLTLPLLYWGFKSAVMGGHGS
jgi:hypothetical protein